MFPHAAGTMEPLRVVPGRWAFVQALEEFVEAEEEMSARIDSIGYGPADVQLPPEDWDGHARMGGLDGRPAKVDTTWNNTQSHVRMYVSSTRVVAESAAQVTVQIPNKKLKMTLDSGAVVRCPIFMHCPRSPCDSTPHQCENTGRGQRGGAQEDSQQWCERHSWRGPFTRPRGASTTAWPAAASLSAGVSAERLLCRRRGR